MKVTQEAMLEAQEKDIENDTPAGETAAPEPDSETESAVEAAAAEPVAEETADPAGEGPQSDSQSEPQDDPQSDSESDPAAAEPASELEQTIAERDQAVAEKAELLDRYQRAQAEFDNFRKRLVREKEEAHNYAAMDTVRSLLPVADDFERALASESLDDEVRKGLDLVYKAMFDVFTRAGLKPVEEDGKFDPHVHHAVDKQPAETDEDDQTVLEVYQRGYHFKDRLLRPAMVKVAVKE